MNKFVKFTVYGLQLTVYGLRFTVEGRLGAMVMMG